MGASVAEDQQAKALILLVAKGDWSRHEGKMAIYWDDGQRRHACDSGEVAPGEVLVWTLCNKDVPAGAAFTTLPPDALPVTCPECNAMKETLPVEIPRHLLRDVIMKRGGVQPLNDRELSEIAAEAVPEVLREWLSDGRKK
jgi:hypothetical protein